jgi:hypothetical protein
VSPLEAALLVITLFLPACWLVRHALDNLTDPAYLREHGVVIVVERALQAHTASIGEYMGHPIWGTVSFMGSLYRFDRIIRQEHKERIGPRELYLDPGLVYVTE